MEDDDYARMADEAYTHRHEVDQLEQVEVDVDQDVRSVVSVRFNRGELGPIDTAARAAGVPLSTYIRNAALRAATGAPTVDAAGVRKALDALQRELDEVRRLAGVAESAKKRRVTRKNSRTA
ncbi:hypothetical protein [Phytohabitans rumicis]|nr:hypothetical protein [Phytohabitans rumicis]